MTEPSDLTAQGAAGPDLPPASREHPRTIGWLGTTALAMGGSNQSLFLIGALIAGQGTIPGQGTAAIPLLAIGLLLGWMAMFGWTELILMFPNRVGGIAATCGEAFRPYAPVLGNLTGVCYWWGWVPTCGLTALLSASAIHDWCLPALHFTVPVPVLASGLILLFLGINLCGVKWVTRITVPIAFASAGLAFASAVIPVVAGRVDWHQACSFHLDVPFAGSFGKITSIMAGLYLVGFAAPAFEAAACHVGETINPGKNVPRAMFASATMATLYFLVLPVIWLGTIGGNAMSCDLAQTLGPIFAPAFFGGAKAAAAAFMMFNMFHGTIAPLTGVCRTLSQLADDGLLPEAFARRMPKTDAPWVASLVTALCAIAFLLIGDPIWLIAAANLTYLIGISLPNIAVWLLRRDQPQMLRPYRAPRGTIALGLIAALVWGVSTVLGFEQFGLPTVIFGLALAYSGSALYAWRRWSDHRGRGERGIPWSLHFKLTGAMLLVLALDGAGYIMAVQSAGAHGTALVAALEDIFVVVALLTISVGLVLPGMIAHSAVEVANAARRLATGTLADFSRAMEALSAGNLDAAHARVDVVPVVVHTRDELGQMAVSFNMMQEEVARAAMGLEGAREGVRQARNELTAINAQLEKRVVDRTTELENTHKKLVEAARQAGMAEVAADVLHNVGNVLNSVNVSAELMETKVRKSRLPSLASVTGLLKQHAGDMSDFLTGDERGRNLPAFLDLLSRHLANEQADVLAELKSLRSNIEHIKQIVNVQQSFARLTSIYEPLDLAALMDDAVRVNYGTVEPTSPRIVRQYTLTAPVTSDKHRVLQVVVNLVNNAKYAVEHGSGRDKSITLRVGRGEGGRGARIEVIDSGMGIWPKDMPRLFSHGFTTKKGGHGFGLHSSALAAREVGGTLTALSDGPGYGATFILELPAAPPAVGWVAVPAAA